MPLNLNKLDLKDYLYHAYSVRVLSVRSYVQQQRVRQDKPSAKKPSPRRWFRPRSIKKMTVEMDRGFAWPDEPEDYSAWDKKTFDAVREAQEKEREGLGREGALEPTEMREAMAEQAKRLLRGEERWKPIWENVGGEVEVEKNVQV